MEFLCKSVIHCSRTLFNSFKSFSSTLNDLSDSVSDTQCLSRGRCFSKSKPVKNPFIRWERRCVCQSQTTIDNFKAKSLINQNDPLKTHQPHIYCHIIAYKFPPYFRKATYCQVLYIEYILVEAHHRTTLVVVYKCMRMSHQRKEYEDGSKEFQNIFDNNPLPLFHLNVM